MTNKTSDAEEPRYIVRYDGLHLDEARDGTDR